MTKESLTRCVWCGTDELYTKYHDEEWGKHTDNEKTLFEFLILEAAQAGLSWITILRRREHYRRLFADFDVEKVANFSEETIESILLDPGVIRHRGKITSAVSNAKIFMDIQKEFGSFYAYLYSFMPENKSLAISYSSHGQIPATSPQSDAISKDLKKRGIKFFGSTICYAYMQAVGMVNDHVLSCDFRN